MAKSPEAVRPRRAGRRARHPPCGGRLRFPLRQPRARATSPRSRRWARIMASSITRLEPVGWAGRGLLVEPDPARRSQPGEVALAHDLLGRPFDGRGPGGRGRPARPRARLSDRQPSPAQVSARCGRRPGSMRCARGGARARVDALADAVASLGWRPTFDGRDLRLEVHLFDREADLYGRRLCCAFVERLRGEESFESVEALRAQMDEDCVAARSSPRRRSRARRVQMLRGRRDFLDIVAAAFYVSRMRARPLRGELRPALAGAGTVLCLMDRESAVTSSLSLTRVGRAHPIRRRAGLSLTTNRDACGHDARAAKDYRATVFLPRTDFPMRASLPAREPEILERWAAARPLPAAARGRRRGGEKFVLHDGPPYANGHLHMGTALNKILKDVVNRSQQMLGKDAVYVPGWDCHGLPIEWQIEQRYREAGLDKDAVPIAEFRQECREFAAALDRRPAQRVPAPRRDRRLGRPLHHDGLRRPRPGSSASSAKFLLSGELYRGKKSVMWSVVEKTALAEAEVEYHDHTSTTIFVRFPVVRRAAPGARRRGGGDLDHDALDHARQPRGRLRRGGRLPGDRGRGGRERLASRGSASGCCLPGSLRRRGRRRGRHHRAAHACRGRRAEGSRPRRHRSLRHPLHGKGYDFDVPMLAADFVDHRAGHGPRPHRALARRRRLRARRAARPRGARYGRRGRPLHAATCRCSRGLHVFKAAEPVIEALHAERRAARARQAGAQLPAFLALQGAADLPRDAAVVHPDGGAGRAARQGAGRDRCDPLGPGRREATGSAA